MKKSYDDFLLSKRKNKIFRLAISKKYNKIQINNLEECLMKIKTNIN